MRLLFGYIAILTQAFALSAAFDGYFHEAFTVLNITVLALWIATAIKPQTKTTNDTRTTTN